MIQWSRKFFKLASLHPTHAHEDLSSVSGFVSEIKLGFETPCRVAFAIAQRKKRHTIEKRLINPYTMDIIEKKTITTFVPTISDIVCRKQPQKSQ